MKETLSTRLLTFDGSPSQNARAFQEAIHARSPSELSKSPARDASRRHRAVRALDRFGLRAARGDSCCRQQRAAARRARTTTSTFGAAPSLGVTTFTLETWFKRTAAGVGVTTGTGGIPSAIPLVTKAAPQGETPNEINANYFLGIDATSGQLVADFEEPTGPNHPVTGNAVVASNVWHHAAVTLRAPPRAHGTSTLTASWTDPRPRERLPAPVG